MQPLLIVDLNTEKTTEYSIPPQWEEEYIGGASLGARLLYSVLSKDLDPFSSDSPLLFLTGPLTGTLGPTVGRFIVCGKSPATGLWAESNCGGFWGPELRFCGYDGLWITGRSQSPVYLWLNDDRLEIRDAAGVWGKDTFSSQQKIKAEISDNSAHVLTIGPAGENKVVFAGLFCDHGRTAGRTGLGAVAGSKNLKAIAVKGTKPIPLAEADEYKRIRSAVNKALKNDNVSQVTHDVGTAGVADYADYLGSMPKKYYRQGVIENIDRISGATMSETILVGYSACHGCIIACGRVVTLDDSVKQKGPEYETVVGFGPNILNTNLAEIVRLNGLCDQYGLDTISASNIIGLAFFLFERGMLKIEDIGFPLVWGDTTAAGKLLHQMTYGEGIGIHMQRGSRHFAAIFGAVDEAVQVNGLEVAYHDPRGVSGMGLVYVTSPRGACHNKSDYFFVDWGQADEGLGLRLFDRHDGADKAVNVARHQDWRSLCDSLVMCFFGNVPIDSVVDLLNSACRYSFTPEGLLRCGERGWNLKRVINYRLGLRRETEVLPKALALPYPDGPVAGYEIPIEEMLQAYYQARGWDLTTGKPGKEKLLELGMDLQLNDLWL